MIFKYYQRFHAFGIHMLLKGMENLLISRGIVYPPKNLPAAPTGRGEPDPYQEHALW